MLHPHQVALAISFFKARCRAVKICEMIGHDATFIKHGRAIARAIGGHNGVEVVALYLAARSPMAQTPSLCGPTFFGCCQARNGSGSVLFQICYRCTHWQ